MEEKKGILYGLGVGPGDPELITLKAARTLNMVDVVFAAASTKNAYSLAMVLVQPEISMICPRARPRAIKNIRRPRGHRIRDAMP